jgi:ATP-dependent DNA helicase PIF1
MSKLPKSLASLIFGQPISNVAKQAAPAAASAPPRPASPPHPGPARTGSDSIIELPEYRLVEELILAPRPPVILLSGRAGTGKSVAIRWLASRFEGACAIVAPTGLAAIQVGGQTIHSLFRLPPRAIQESDIKPPDGRSRDIFAHLKVLIIDEVSMVRADLMDGIGTFLTRFGPKPGTPFGGVKLVLVGDMLQLPPVIESKEERAWLQDRYGSEYFFSAACFRQHSWVPVELTRVFRQSEQEFIEVLSRIRAGEEVAAAVAWMNRHCAGRQAPPNALEIALVPTRARAEEINRAALARLAPPERRYSARVEGTVSADWQMPSPNDLDLRVGAQVVFTKNDVERRWVNGTMGRVVALGERQVTVAIGSGSTPVVVTEHRWDRYRYEWDPSTRRLTSKVAGSFIQIPLAHAWATTIHKAQGQTFDRALVDMGNGAFASGQTYVALSRCRTRDGLRLQRPIREDDVRIDPKISAAYREMRRAAGQIDAEAMVRELRAARGRA